MDSRARAFEAAGDECVYTDRVEEAKVNFGWAIDAFLEAGAYEESIRICRKLIRLSPEVVRTRFTLLFLLVGLKRHDEALDALDAYMRLVRASGTGGYAVPRLQLLAHVTEDPGMSTRLRQILEEFGAGPASAGVGRPERWLALLPIALRDD